MSRRRTGEPELTVIWWRDIPAQVVARQGPRAVRGTLPDRFQRAIDRAAMRAGVAHTAAYLDLWERRSRPCGGDLQAEVDAEVARLDAGYPPAALADLVRATPRPARQRGRAPQERGSALTTNDDKDAAR